MNLDVIEANLRSVRQRISEAAEREGRGIDDVGLVAVTKNRPIEAVRRLVELGVFDLGENKPQELWKRAAEIDDPRVNWHLIGRLQTNKAKRTYPLTKLVHSVDSLKLLAVLDEIALGLDRPAEVCLQVNVSGEASKQGWSLNGILADAAEIGTCAAVPIVGLMTMAPLDATVDETRKYFDRLRRLSEDLRVRLNLKLPVLSMGMSADFEVAIEEGATLVRVGSALFEGLET